MNRIPLDKGRMALATAGRDEGKLFVVIGIVDDEYVFISDGKTRKLVHPKLKKKKHLKAKPYIMDIPDDGNLTDAGIRRFLTDSSKKEG
ncbi:MAG: KOW domain-containing protein [Clostridia bacterium]|nr:KOW domain-containing protein [Clostridia bacterium]